MKKGLFLLLILSIQFGLYGQKMKGLSFVGSSEKIDSTDVMPIVEVNANWVSIMPFGFIRNGKVMYNSKWQWWGEKTEGARETIRLCQESGLKIMLKPQIWIMGAYTGDFTLEKEGDWMVFERSYREFVMEFVQLAVEMKVDLFCVGTEWREFVKERPVFWKKLIGEVKETYSGKLTYAANWDDYKDVPFWKELDYIGVDAYFPICVSSDSKYKEMCASWKKYSAVLGQFSKEQGLKILFTEFGYRSLAGTTKAPWVSDTKGKCDLNEQNNGYKAIFETVWKEDWLAGGFVWKWFHNHESHGGKKNLGFTPQNKPAEETIRQFWKENN